MNEHEKNSGNEQLPVIPEEIQQSVSLPNSAAGHHVLSIVHTAESTPKSVEVTYDMQDFPEDASWGMEDTLLPGSGSPEYRKHSRQTCFARALDAMKHTNTPIDWQLAVAACVSNAIINTGAQFEYASFLRKFSYNADTGEVVAVYSSDPATGSREPYELRFSAETILEYHIPTLAGEQISTEDLNTNPQEALWKNATRQGSDLTLASWGVNKGLLPELVGQFVITQKDGRTILAHIPIASLDLTRTELDLVNIGKELNDMLTQIRLASGNLYNLAEKLKDAEPMVGLFRKRRKHSIDGKHAAQLQNDIDEFHSHTVDPLRDQPEQIILAARSSGEKRDTIPHDFQVKFEAIKTEWNRLCSEFSNIQQVAAAKGIEVSE